MNLWRWLFGRDNRPAKARPITPSSPPTTEKFVSVMFLDLTTPMPATLKTARKYVYRWPLATPPSVGDRLVVPVPDGVSFAVVLGPATRADLQGHAPKTVQRRVTDEEVAAAQSGISVWIESMKVIAGLPSGLQQPREVPDQPPYPPADGSASSAAEAATWGRIWWRASMRAASEAERERFKELALYWFHIRDELSALTTQEIIRRSHPKGLVDGRHYTEWTGEVAQLKREGRYPEALNLLEKCQAATIRQDKIRPAPWYFEQAAIIHRKLKDPASEVAVLERYVSTATEPSTRLIERLEKARVLLQGRSRSA